MRIPTISGHILRPAFILVFAVGILTGIAVIGSNIPINQTMIPAAAVNSTFIYSFNTPGILEEAGSMDESTSPYWWLNSGGQLLIRGNLGSTMFGIAPQGSRWQKAYASAASVDTDQGAHPQNLFRLITRSSWTSVRQEGKFLVARDTMSASPNRNASNGLLLMSRYKDAGQTLYYAGIRVDGTAVIKKKYRGTYYTMAQKEAFPGLYVKDGADINLLPHNEWIRLRSDTVNNADGSVTVRLYIEGAGETQWTLLLEAADEGQYGSTAPIRGAGYAGIRTDFMDVKFESYQLSVIAH